MTSSVTITACKDKKVRVTRFSTSGGSKHQHTWVHYDAPQTFYVWNGVGDQLLQIKEFDKDELESNYD